VPGEVIANSGLAGQTNAVTTLGAAITSTGATSITTAGGAAGNLLNGNFRALIGDGTQNSGDFETVLVTAGQSGTTWTVVRGVEGSTAYTWANSTPIYHVWTQTGVQQAVTPRVVQRNLQMGVATEWTYDPYASAANLGSLAPTSQSVYGVMAGFNAGDTVTNIWMILQTAAAGTAPTHMYLGLYAANGAQLAITADVASSSSWKGTLQPIGFALASPYTFTAPQGAYIVVWQDGSFGTTQPILHTQPVDQNAHIISGLSYYYSVIQTSQASMPAPATWTSLGGGTLEFIFGWS
jgi:hypothetical protein